MPLLCAGGEHRYMKGKKELGTARKSTLANARAHCGPDGVFPPNGTFPESEAQRNHSGSWSDLLHLSPMVNAAGLHQKPVLKCLTLVSVRLPTAAARLAMHPLPGYTAFPTGLWEEV